MKIYSLVILLFTTTLVFGQTQNGAYTAIGKGVATTFLNDYQSLGVNTSMLGTGTGYEDKKMTFGTSEMAFSIYSPALTKQNFINLRTAISNEITGNSEEGFNLTEQKEAVANFAEKGIAMNANLNWFGFAYQGEKFGGIAVQVREKFNWYSQLNEQTTDIIFRGQFASIFDSLTVAFNGDTTKIANRPGISQDTLAAAISGQISSPILISELTNGTKIKQRWDREWNIGYGRKIFGKPETFALYGGISGRYIQSVAHFDFESNDDGVSLYSALSPTFDIDYGAIANSNPSAVIGDASRKIPEIVGNGYGFDLSATVKMAKIFTFGLAINNLGSVTYNKNIYKVRDTLIGSVSLNGLSDPNVLQSVNRFLDKDGILEIEGQEKLVVANSATIRLGGSMELFKRINFGVDIVAPFNKDNPGSLANPIISAGGDFKLFKWLTLSAGYYGGGVYKSNVPLGVNFILRGGAYEFGISSTDILRFVSENTNSVSTAFGFARIRF
ncbi:hypothetical protein SAMN05216474_1207 [Lishizhenia tianjinensis]|uniref:DUF5723 domain-containing protein n=1 Tax=Lishizhenia tianjinensis TaxID=477690 RepID=A0A1I6YV54_9FLAO|nr:DUF5723 family protein [Lishizhenia tianjinensis]SFT54309.1 hypothetical protein SAMN05216474_1207 [Lishizhenia tianjinensis]